MSSADSRIFPGIARDSGTFGMPSRSDPATLVVTTSQSAPCTRTVAVYLPAQYVPGTIAPFIVGADGPDQSLFTALDNLIAEAGDPAKQALPCQNEEAILAHLCECAFEVARAHDRCLRV